METHEQGGRRQSAAFHLMAWSQLGIGFTTYAAGAIMILYLYQPLHLGGLGIDRITATQIMAVFTSLGYFAGIAGSYAADRLVGLRRPFLLGTLLNIVAVSLLAIPSGGRKLFFVSLALQILAAGITGQSLNALVGLLFHGVSGARNRAFTIIYIVNNIGAAGPIITGTVAVQFGYHAGFLVAAVVLLMTTVPYLVFNRRDFGNLGQHPVDPMRLDERRQFARRTTWGTAAMIILIGVVVRFGWLTPSSFSDVVGVVGIVLPVIYVITIVRSAKVTSAEAHRVRVYFLFLVGNAVTMLVSSQSTGIVTLYTQDHVNLHIWGMSFSAASFQTIPAVIAVLFGGLLTAVWGRSSRYRLDESWQYGLGLLLWGAGPLLMMVPLTIVPAGTKASPLWVVGFYVLIVAGESLTSTIGMSLASAVAPAAFVAQMMTVFTLSKASGTGLAAIAANFYTPGHEAAYFGCIGLLALAWGAVMLRHHWRITRGLA